MLPKADLHIHTTFSDGKLDPVEAVEIAVEKKLSALSITDHDTYEGYFAAKERADELGIQLIPGVEITSSYKNRESHILAYFFNTDTQFFADFFISQRIERRNRIKGIIQRLNGIGLIVDYDEVRAEANGANIGRPHLAKVLVNKGYARNHHDAFDRYLSTEKLGEINQNYPEVSRVIETIRSIGGAAVLAHPAKFYSEKEIEEFIKLGIDGIECIHPSHNFTLQKKYTAICEKNALLITGGSDYHGGKEMAKRHLGVVSVALKHVDKMNRMCEQRKQIVELKN
ncbi:MAG: PHP domain-containing protein [Balneola sp.]|nr:MAG: PHP domain-containing protein [Balneola sp.]